MSLAEDVRNLVASGRIVPAAQIAAKEPEPVNNPVRVREVAMRYAYGKITVDEVRRRGIDPAVFTYLLSQVQEDLETKLAELEALKRVVHRSPEFTSEDILKAAACLKRYPDLIAPAVGLDSVATDQEGAR